jgi:glucokinase
VLAVDVGGSHVSCGAVEAQTLLDVVHIETDSGLNLSNLLPVLADELERLAVRHGNVQGIGFGFCGLVDTPSGRIVSTNRKYSDATSVDLVGWARERLGMPLVLENDSRMALLGERHSGAARGSNDVAMITLGTGIGTAAIMAGNLVRGKHSQAGCLGGHFTVAIGGRECSCGGRGCFEAEASTYALPAVSKDWPGFAKSSLASETKIDFEILFRNAEKGDSVAVAIRNRCVRIWAACALSLVHAYDPEVFVIGGGVMRSSFPVLDRIREHVDSCAWTPWGKVQFRKAELGAEAAILGAVPLLQNQLLRSQVPGTRP